MVSAIVRRLTNYLKPGACPLIVQSVNNLRYPESIKRFVSSGRLHVSFVEITQIIQTTESR